MYSAFHLTKKYIHYYFTASNGKGHGIHSPFVFDFVTNVLNHKKNHHSFKTIEKLRHQLLHDNGLMESADFGAGSAIIKSKKRAVKDIAASALKSKKYAVLLAVIARYYKAQNIIELGTSFGITTCYIAGVNKTATVYTFEGVKNIAQIARNNFDKLNLQNIHLIVGNFDDTLSRHLNKIETIDLAFVDGNHRKKPTIRYFNILLKKINFSSIIIFDDIHWSREMEEAWKIIKDHPAVTLSIDLFFIGIVFFRNDFKCKQHFVIRF